MGKQSTVLMEVLPMLKDLMNDQTLTVGERVHDLEQIIAFAEGYKQTLITNEAREA
jgi:hypothetical protein